MQKVGLVLVLFILIVPAMAADCACDLSRHDGFCLEDTYRGTDGRDHHYCCAPSPYDDVMIGGQPYTIMWPGFSDECRVGVNTGGATASGTEIVEYYTSSSSSSVSICSGQNGQACDINPVDGWGGYGLGVCDSSDSACVSCNSNHVETNAWGGGSESELKSSHADGMCESGCGASEICDERAPGATFGGTDHTVDSCSSSCQYSDSSVCEADYGAALSCDGKSIGDVCVQDYCDTGVLYEYDGAGTAYGDGALNGQTCSGTCGCDDTLEAVSVCDTNDCGAAAECDGLVPSAICSPDYCSAGRLYEYDGAGTDAGDNIKNGAVCGSCECDTVVELAQHSFCDTECGAHESCDGMMPDDICAADFCENGTLYEYDGADASAGNEVFDGAKCGTSCGCDDTLEAASYSLCNANVCGADLECSGIQPGDVCRASCGLYAVQNCTSSCGCPECPESCSSDADCIGSAFCDVSEGVCRQDTDCDANRDGSLCEVYCGADAECDERDTGVFAPGEGCNDACEYDNIPPSGHALLALPTYTLDSDLDLRWSRASDANGIDYYEVWRADSSPATAGEVIRTLGDNETFDIREDGPVYYSVRAYDNVGLYSDSAEVSTIVDTGVDLIAQLDDFPAYSTDGEVSVSWSAASDTNGIDNYTLWRRTVGDFVFIVTKPGLSQPESGLADDEYAYMVETLDSAGNSDNSTEKSIIVDTVVDSAAFMDALPDYAQSTVELSWSGAADTNGIDSYLVWKGVASGVYTTSYDAGSYEHYDDSAVFDSTEYFYVVETFDDAGNSENSTEDDIKIDLSPPMTTIFLPVKNDLYSASPVNLKFRPIDLSPSSWDDIFDCDWFLDGEVVNGDTVVNDTDYDRTVSVDTDGPHAIYVICSDDAGNTNNSGSVSFVMDTHPPTYSRMFQNNSLPDDQDWVKLGAYWHDAYVVSDATLEANCSGSWEEFGTVNVSAVSGWSNFTLDVAGCSNNFVHWRVHAYDVAGNDDTTDEMTFEVDREPSVDAVSFSPDDDPAGGYQLDPVGAGYKLQTVSALASDPNGGWDIEEGECWYYGPSSTPDVDEPDHVEDGDVTSKKGQGYYERTIVCAHSFAYDDEPGPWTVRVWATDSKNNNASLDNTFTYLDGIFIDVNGTSIGWTGMVPSQSGVRSNDVLNLNNTGNVALETYFRGSPLEGYPDATVNITVDHMELDDDDSFVGDAGNNPIISYSQTYVKYTPVDGDLAIGETWPVWHYLSTPSSLVDQQYRGSITVCAAKYGEGGCT